MYRPSTIMARKLKSETLSRILELNNGGKSLEEISAETGIVERRVKELIRREQGRVEMMRKREEEAEVIVRLYRDEHETLNQIKRVTGASNTRVRSVLAAAGLYEPTPFEPSVRGGSSRRGYEETKPCDKQIIAELQADLRVIESRKTFGWFQKLTKVAKSAEGRAVYLRVVDTGSELRLVLKFKDKAKQTDEMQRSFPLNQVDLALESVLNFLTPIPSDKGE